jgi:exopolysaccharide biosynthesis polyprenyl glycosylphosphotransferase
MFWRPVHHRILVQATDVVTTLLSFVMAYYLWRLIQVLAPVEQRTAFFEPVLSHAGFMAITSVLVVVIFQAQKAYSYQRFTSFAKEVKIILKTSIILWLLLIGMAFLVRPGYLPRTLMLIFGAVNFFLLTMEKFLLFKIAKALRKRGKNRKSVLIVGTGDQTERFMEVINNHFPWGLDIAGFLDAQGDKVGQELYGKKVLGSFNDILPVLHTHQLDEVIITVSTRRMGEIRNVLDACEREGVQVRIISDFLGRIAKNISTDTIYGLPVISISYIYDNQGILAIKRTMDIIISLVCLIILSPFFLIIAIAVKCSSPGPILFQWNVVGFNKKPFTSWKFRSMEGGAEAKKEKLMHLNEMEGPVFKIKDDPRITPIGKFLRKYSLDELPQLWSVLKGDMSLVGPRPAGPHELVRYESWHRRKLSFKPGITCFWQVNGRNQIHKFDDWVRMDLKYIDNWSLMVDLKILCKTVVTMIRGTGE